MEMKIQFSVLSSPSEPKKWGKMEMKVQDYVSSISIWPKKYGKMEKWRWK